MIIGGVCACLSMPLVFPFHTMLPHICYAGGFAFVLCFGRFHQRLFLLIGTSCSAFSIGGRDFHSSCSVCVKTRSHCFADHQCMIRLFLLSSICLLSCLVNICYDHPVHRLRHCPSSSIKGLRLALSSLRFLQPTPPAIIESITESTWDGYCPLMALQIKELFGTWRSNRAR